MVFVKAFVIGGLICAAVQILMEKTKLMPGRIMVLLVCSGVVLGAVGLYEPILEFAGAGASVPLLGFGNVLWKGIKQAVDEIYPNINADDTPTAHAVNPPLKSPRKPDSYGKNQADAGQDNGSSCMLRRSSGGCRFI